MNRPGMDEAFCPACGSRDIRSDDMGDGRQVAWACGACGYENEDGIPTLRQLLKPGASWYAGTDVDVARLIGWAVAAYLDEAEKARKELDCLRDLASLGF